MSPDRPTPAPHLSDAADAFLRRRALATLTSLRPDGTPHVVPVGFTYDPASGTARVITSRTSVKVTNVRTHPRVALCQADGRDWITLEGEADVHEDTEAVAEAVRLYTLRYRQPRPNPERVLLRIRVSRIMCGSSLRS